MNFKPNYCIIRHMSKRSSKDKKLHVELIRQMLTLATAGFGLVSALAWNSLIQEFVNMYIKKWIPGSGLISLLIYALLITVIAVFITYELSRILQRVEEE